MTLKKPTKLEIKLADRNDAWKDYDHEATLKALDGMAGLWAHGGFPSGADIRRWRREGSRP
jgi:hypothetical protein